MDVENFEPENDQRVFNLVSIIAFIIVVTLGVIFISVLFYRCYTQDVSPY